MSPFASAVLLAGVQALACVHNLGEKGTIGMMTAMMACMAPTELRGRFKDGLSRRMHLLNPQERKKVDHSMCLSV
jgi:hypothetical protein